MPAISARASPWKREPSRPGSVGVVTMALFSTFTETPGGRTRLSVPLAPLISIAPSLTVAVTPFGSAMARLPTRECLMSVVWVVACVVMASPSPDLAEQLAADALAPRLAVGHHAAARAEDRDAHARAHPADAVVPHVD